MALRTLILMRHGDAEDAPSDHERPLSARGRQQCAGVGRQLREAGVEPGAVICSSAERARVSAELVVEALGSSRAPAVDATLYLAEPRAYLAAVHGVDDGIEALLLVAHNPGLSDLASRLLGEHVALPTAGYAIIERELGSWRELGPR
jgi:phosphohistidine phosphatase